VVAKPKGNTEVLRHSKTSTGLQNCVQQEHKIHRYVEREPGDDIRPSHILLKEFYTQSLILPYTIPVSFTQ